MAMLADKDYLDLEAGTTIWAVYPGFITSSTFASVQVVPSIWGNFPHDLVVRIEDNDYADTWHGMECADRYLDKDEAEAAAIKMEQDCRKSQMDAAVTEMHAAWERMDSPITIRVDPC